MLRINLVEAYDSGEYTCSVQSDPPIGVEIRHFLQVNGNKIIKCKNRFFCGLKIKKKTLSYKKHLVKKKS